MFLCMPDENDRVHSVFPGRLIGGVDPCAECSRRNVVIIEFDRELLPKKLSDTERRAFDPEIFNHFPLAFTWHIARELGSEPAKVNLPVTAAHHRTDRHFKD